MTLEFTIIIVLGAALVFTMGYSLWLATTIGKGKE
jgi:hypothetical protein